MENNKKVNKFTDTQKEILKFYSPYSFIRSIKDEKHLDVVEKSLSNVNVQMIDVEDDFFYFYYQYNKWESNYFGKNIYKLFNVLYTTKNYYRLVLAINKFEKYILNKVSSLIYFEIPSEDIVLIQALGENKFRLLETRLTYFNDSLKKYEYNRFNVRFATQNDTNSLKNIAGSMRNIYDRFHSDQSFSQDIADNYLSTYIENSINGFTDVVLIPNQENLPIEAFLTANYLKSEWETLGYNVSKMVLSAVGPSCKGWYVKLISEMTYLLRDNGANCIFMNTQSTNKAVIKTWEALGYKYGNSVHVFSKSI